MHAKQVFDYLVRNGGSVKEDIVSKLGFSRINSDQLEILVGRVCHENPQAVEDLKA